MFCMHLCRLNKGNVAFRSVLTLRGAERENLCCVLTLVLGSHGSDCGVPHWPGEDPHAESTLHRLLRG
uniref:Uncharacterized protein n=1 Tax=Anguilla anguilla TaxID=7936 RepID=A0A0E9U5W3_ANGAN